MGANYWKWYNIYHCTLCYRKYREQMQLSILENRLLHEIPEDCHNTVQKEFSRFEMETSRLSEELNKIGQAKLTDREIERAATTNQNGDYGHTIIELQVIKGVAMHYGIDDWLSYVDPQLTYEENVSIIESECAPTSKEINAKEKMKTVRE